MVTVPARLLELPNVSVLHQDADVLILEKRLQQSQEARASYTSMHVLAVVVEGEQYVEIADGPSHHVRAGEAMLLRRGLYTVTDLIAAPGADFTARLIYFTGRGVKPAGSKADTTEAPPPFPFRVAWPSSRGSALKLLGRLPGIATVLRAPRRCDPVNFLREHYDKALTLDDLAYLTGMSVSTFQRQFRRQTGESPRNWIIARRMAQARKLLQQGLAVARVAERVGYRNTSHFIATYRRTYGRTPLTEYRHFTATDDRPLP